MEKIMEEEKRGRGRPVGSKNKRTEELFERLQAMPCFMHPAEFLMEQMSNKKLDMALRIKCASEVLPYMAPKLKQIEVSGVDEGPIEIVYRWDEDDEPDDAA